MRFATAIACLALIGCASKPNPDTLFPNAGESEDFKDGFRAGFYEGLTWNQTIPNA